MGETTVEFRVLCEMLDAVSSNKKPALKRKNFRTFLDHVYTDHEYFSAMRLILPELDRERGTYGLKEAVLAKCLAEALGLSKESQDAQSLLNWRKGGTKIGINAGNFALIAAEILHRRQRITSGHLTIKDVNDQLDRLAAAENREQKSAILAELINKTNAQEMRWMIMIILKDLKLGVSEKTIFHQFHPDAEDLFNVTCDLRLVCTKLRDRTQRYNRHDIEVGKPVRPQLAARIANVESAWKKFRGKQVVVECKFDGNRIQLHKDGSDIHFFSRNFIDHEQFKEAFSKVISDRIIPDKCILDGEMLVWNRVTNRFADFGTIPETAKAMNEGLETDQQLCYIAFDILYAGDGSVIHRPLRERHQLLKKFVNPVKGCLELLLPDDGLNSERNSGEPPWSILPSSAEDADRFFKETVENRDEGIIWKDYDSKWEPGDRSGKWFKLKPDYIHTGSDLDALIIGGYFGSGRRGGEVAQFLLGLSEKSKSGGYPTRFLSFCKVGTGLADEECKALVQRLQPYFRENSRYSAPPSFYVVTNNAKERPDVWIDQPDKSVILEITSDIRTIKSDVFASPYSLRFPRVHRVRYDKPWYDCLDVQTLVELVHSRSGSTVDLKTYGTSEQKPKRAKTEPKLGSRTVHHVPAHLLVTDVSQVKRTSNIFKDLVFYFVNFPEAYTKESLHKLVVENGGTFSMNLNDLVTHSIAAEKKGIKYQAAATHGDVIHNSWVLGCILERKLLSLRPKYFLHLSNLTKNGLKEGIDEFGDDYFEDIDQEDLSQLFGNIQLEKLPTNMDTLHYRNKYCPNLTRCLFQNCKIYFHNVIHTSNMDFHRIGEVTLRMLKLEVSMLAGSVTTWLNSSTHLVVFSLPDSLVSLNAILEIYSPEEQKILLSNEVKIVSHKWLEDALEGWTLPHEADYDLRVLNDIDVQENETLSSSPTHSHCSPRQSKVHSVHKSTKKRSSRRDVRASSESDEVTPKRRLHLDKKA
ncbi:hypothetical protein O6H91_14G031600 [Diphasiastrum complanatum]|uniref:Uncharacterized protein n=4 Tax=Diphasiastrum complanatum TaxID=34168 RepID=A0ACC2BNK0_DIPCM|nr:hypothetical protein O6H91_14G031600 [Diphasiastrum complanatum]KAJ7531082.1 hypothetical protein O6H91_14G031600 [Diphasiastrum complanatum]KAJ7531083.1 hypothetical protein O6H91_14G031600 [Diphasiastrum complanatum]KAJ7531084.1 hypothetical protein O6H91_14G031600 [Diphasiastrum complanatum]